jgi:hypothetical protein
VLFHRLSRSGSVWPTALCLRARPNDLRHPVLHRTGHLSERQLSQPDPDRNQHPDPDRDPHRHAHGNSNHYAHQHTDRHADKYPHQHTNTDADGYTHEHGDEYGNTDSNEYAGTVGLHRRSVQQQHRADVPAPVYLWPATWEQHLRRSWIGRTTPDPAGSRSVVSWLGVARQKTHRNGSGAFRLRPVSFGEHPRMDTSDPDAVSTKRQAQPLSGASVARFPAAVQRGDLPNLRTSREVYQINGSDLITWRAGVRTEIVTFPVPRVAPGARFEVVERLQWLTDDEVREVLATIRGLITHRRVP